MNRTKVLTAHLTSSAAAAPATTTATAETPAAAVFPNSKYRADWEGKLKSDKVNPHLARNNAPTTTEGAFADLPVLEGKLPLDMEPGCYLRVGPNPKFDFSRGVPYHTFDGDGMIHSVTFSGGKKNSAAYVKRWIRTRRLVTSEQRGFDVSEIGEQTMGSFSFLEHITDSNPLGPRSKARMGRANTNLVAHANRLLALEEHDLPYHIATSWDLDSHLRTVGRLDFDGKLSPVCTAHPKVCGKTGELIMFGYSAMHPKITYTVASARGVVDHEPLVITLPSDGNKKRAGSMMHDMAITEHYSLLFDWRFEFDLKNMTSGANPWVHRRDVPARFGVLPRHAKSESEIKWIDVNRCSLFHFANAWEEQYDAKTGAAVIKIVGARMDTFQFVPDAKTATTGSGTKYARLYEWTLDFATGKCLHEGFVGQDGGAHTLDFPQINVKYTGQRNRFVYTQFMVPKVNEVHPDYVGGLFLIKGVLKHDLERGGEIKSQLYRTQQGKQMLGTEAVFAPKLNPKAEDDGYLVVYAYDEDTAESQCLIYNSQLELECRLGLPERVPFGFHGYWMSGSFLK